MTIVLDNATKNIFDFGCPQFDLHCSRMVLEWHFAESKKIIIIIMDTKRVTTGKSSNRYSLFNLIHFQLLGEEMYSTRERDYQKHGSRNLRSEHSSRSASPDMARADNLGYEDSLDVAFEHNNKLRDKIQQRMRESENLIASTFGQKSNNELIRGFSKKNELDITKNSYSSLQNQGHITGSNLSDGDYNPLHSRDPQEEHNDRKMNLESSGIKGKMNSSLGGLLDKALSNLWHNNEKHDHK